MTTNLDKFLNDKKSEDFTLTINGKKKIYTAKYTGYEFLQFSTIGANPEADQSNLMVKALEIVFGKKNAKELLDNINAQGLTLITQAVLKGINATNIEEKK